MAIADGTSLDVIEMDAASNRSIDDVRDLRDKIAFAPVDGRFKVYIVDEVHMLTREAFNALLKTLEEPPDNVIFVLATTEAHKIPETIVSRCQRFDFRRPQVTDIVRLLAGIVERENARPADERGGPPIDIQARRCTSSRATPRAGSATPSARWTSSSPTPRARSRPSDVLEALGVTSSDLLFEITDIVTERRTAEALQFVQRLANEGTDYSQFIRDLLRHLRQLFLLQHLGEAASDEATLRTLGQTVELDGELFREQLQRAGQVSPREVVYFIEALGQAQREIRDGLDPRLQLELALVKVTRPELDHSAAALEERLRRLEAAAAGAGPAPAAPRPRRREAGGRQGRRRERSRRPGAARRAASRRRPPPRRRRHRPTPAAAAGRRGRAPRRPPPRPRRAAPHPPLRRRPPRSSRSSASSAPGSSSCSASRPSACRSTASCATAVRPPSRADVLTVALPSEFALRNADQRDNAEVLAAAVEGVLGRRVTARVRAGLRRRRPGRRRGGRSGRRAAEPGGPPRFHRPDPCRAGQARRRAAARRVIRRPPWPIPSTTR